MSCNRLGDARVTYQLEFPLAVLVGEGLPIVIDQFERPANLGFPHAFGRFCYPFPAHALLLCLEIPRKAAGGHQEDQARAPRKRLFPSLLDCCVRDQVDGSE